MMLKKRELVPIPGGLNLLPAAPGLCEQCAVDHPPHFPHNQQSLHWQYYFYGKNGRWPTWVDAMSHCDQKMKDFWIAELAKKGVVLAGDDATPKPKRVRAKKSRGGQ